MANDANKNELLIKGELNVGLALKDIICTVGAKVEVKKTEPIERYQLNKTYQKELHNQKCNYRNPDQIAAITWEDIPMDMTCAKATAKVIGDIMKCSVKLKVYCHDDLRYVTTSDGQESQDLMVISVKLSENHFTSETSSDKRKQNDCLYQCLPSEIKQKISPIEFREKLVKEIEIDLYVSGYIKTKLHDQRVPNEESKEVEAMEKEFDTEDLNLEIIKFFDNLSLLTGVPAHKVVDYL